MKHKRVGLFFGSFNPIHNGHLILAELIVEKASLDECWLILSPHNPHKKRSGLLHQNHRLFFIQEALINHPKIKINTIEFKLPTPNYTINTLIHLIEKYPEIEFSIIMGMDNLEGFQQWRQPEEILELVKILVYPRIGFEMPEWAVNSNRVLPVSTPILEISSTQIRERIKKGLSIFGFVPNTVAKIIEKEGFYMH